MSDQPGTSSPINAAAGSWSPDHAGRLLSALDELEGETPPNDAAPPGYEILKLLGHGGSARVFLARRAGSERPVALKIIGRLGQLERPSAGGRYARAWRELEILEGLRVPCVPQILDYGTHAGQFYLAEEYIQGHRLSEWSNATPTLRAKVAMLAKAARCVQEIHERGVIHRDLKPSNILVTLEGEPVIIDFGLARGAADHTLTESGAPVGTPAFMAPEQAVGKRESISTRTDVYGLGATAYFLLTGMPPHQETGGLHDLIRRVASEPAPDPRREKPELPAALAAVLLKCCDLNPARRYDSAANLAADLERWLEGRPVEAQPPTGFQRLVRWAARHPRWATAAACAAIALTSLGTASGLIWWGWTRPAGTRRLGYNQGIAVVSGLNRILKSWETGASEGIGGSAQVQRSNGQHALVIAFDQPESLTRSQALCAFSFEEGGTLLWSSDDPARALIMPPKEDTTQSNAFAARRVIMADVFDTPGLELIAIHRNLAYSGSCIRVYDAEGAVLSECWHDGALWDVQWIPNLPQDAGTTEVSKGLAIIAGVNSERTYAQMDLPAGKIGTNPPVVFALRPPRGKCRWLATPTMPDPEGNGDVRPEWYLYLSPSRLATNAFAEGVQVDRAAAGRGNLFRLAFNAAKQHPNSESLKHVFWMFGLGGPTGDAAKPVGQANVLGRELPYWTTLPE